MNLRATLEDRLRRAMSRAGVPDSPAMVAPSSRPQFGDYQANGIMPAAKALRANPRQLAEKVVAEAGLSDVAEKVEVAGPGFINITLKREFVESRLAEVADDSRIGVAAPDRPQTVVVDYSGPNLAKEMHVGHLRSTIIGDALARLLDFVGHKVTRQNHVGDWGTQFGMLIEHLTEKHLTFRGATVTGWGLRDLEDFYRAAKSKYDTDPAFAQKARERVVLLQAKEPGTVMAWMWFLGESMDHCNEVYRRLGVTLAPGDVRGESAYNDDLPKVVADLQQAGLLAESQGAQGVFLDEFRNKDNEPAFVIVRKSDGGYLYATTDLAAIRYRVNTLKADRVLYVTDSRQSLHFQQVFTIARNAGFSPPDVSLQHVPFGMMLGDARTPFKTREGGTVKLMDLLDEAEARALALVRDKAAERGEELSADDLGRIAHVVGIGAVKYADLSQNRASDYVFSWDKMLSLEGNTAPYMQYAYARIRSIFRRGAEDAEIRNPKSEIRIAEPAERLLAVRLLKFSETVHGVADECLPNLLCAYLYDLAGEFMGFYESCPVLQSDEPVRSSRLALCDLTARTIRTGLSLLGIEVIERM